MGVALDMLRSPLAFKAIQAQSSSRVHPLLIVRFRRNDLDRTRYGISTGRRLGSAVVRNRVRRRMKSVLRVLGGRVSAGWDILLVARPPAAEATQAQLAQALDRLLRAAGLMEGTASKT
ncbi:MAG TPA: ribonuclease P protein component [Candidatus Limnocylindria bacterium]|nr:ribonuclease P protein component [Candidatus Limnocylindria bacterium]